MVKSTFAKRAVLTFLATFALGSFPVFSQTEDDTQTKEPVILEVNIGSSAGIPNARYTGTDEKTGVTYGFDFTVNSRQVPDEENGGNKTEYYLDNVTFYGAAGDEFKVVPKSLVLPDLLSYDFMGNEALGEIKNLSFNFLYEQDSSFINLDGMNEIYLPNTVAKVDCVGSDITSLFKMHFKTEACPTFNFTQGADVKMVIYVPTRLFETYVNGLGGKNYVVQSDDSPVVTINVESPGSLSADLYNYIEDLKRVHHVVLKGVPNDDDMLVFRLMPYLETLDLSQTNLKKIQKIENLKYLTEVFLPETLTELGENAFLNAVNLMKIEIPDGVTYIANAFQGCSKLYYIKLPASLKIIGDYAFNGCTNLSSLELPLGLEQIGDDSLDYSYVFNDTNIKNLHLPSTVSKIERGAFKESVIEIINLENVTFIGEEAFRHCSNLKKVDLNSLEELGIWAFFMCDNLTEVKFGDKLKSIPYQTFSDCDIREIIIPDNMESIGFGAFRRSRNLNKITLGKNLRIKNNTSDPVFSGSKPNEVINYALYPNEENIFDIGSRFPGSILYVPALTIDKYMAHDAWQMFENYQPIPDSDMTDVTFDQPIALRANIGLADKANITNNTELTIGRKSPLNLNSFVQGQKPSYFPWGEISGYEAATLIVEEIKDIDGNIIGCDVSADNLTLEIPIPTNRWSFLSFPFDINVEDIVTDNDVLWVVRRYDGELRSKLADSSWVNVADGGVLKAGEGYIFHCKSLKGNGETNFTFKPADNGTNFFFTRTDINTPLEKHESEFLHNDSWNLIGNSYPAYVGIQAIEFDAPITVWDGNTYYAYLPVDDDYVLQPYQAFFVQRQDIEGGDVLTIKGAARAHTREDALAWANDEAMKAPSFNHERVLFNIYVEGENGKDRTRVVINENTTFDYKNNRDASKFMSSEIQVPQIYVLNGDVAMAINERPLGNGEFNLGTRFGNNGNYVISLDSRDADGYTAYLLDRKTGATVNISETSYAFTADEGTDDERFILTMTRGFNGEEDESGVENAVTDNTKVTVNGNILNVTTPEVVEITVYSADGKLVASTKDTVLDVMLDGGIYIVKAGNKAVKVIAGK